MPEGPEIALEADRIRGAIEGREVDCVRFAFEGLRHRTKSFEGARVQSVTARGKAMLHRPRVMLPPKAATQRVRPTGGWMSPSSCGRSTSQNALSDRIFPSSSTQ